MFVPRQDGTAENTWKEHGRRASQEFRNPLPVSPSPSAPAFADQISFRALSVFPWISKILRLRFRGMWTCTDPANRQNSEMLEKTFDPKSVEPRLYAQWEASGAFAPKDDPAAEAFSIVIPPPNVTGSLHIGHALNNTLQDVLIRFERMRGKAALWLPGTDHAGIATQMMVERQLRAEAGNQSRRDLGREAFVEKIWEWKAKSGGTIVNQLKRLGASCDLVPRAVHPGRRPLGGGSQGLCDALQAKAHLPRQAAGELGPEVPDRDQRPRGRTARGRRPLLALCAYPLEDGSGEIVVATTRPETMLGDTAVAVHPTDERYKAMESAAPCACPSWVARADHRRRISRPGKGLGRGQDHARPRLQRLHGRQAQQPADDQHFRRLREGERQRRLWNTAAWTASPPARKVVEAFEALGLLRGVEKTRHMVPHGDRSGVVVEPYLTDQWYVNAEVLAKPAIEAIENGYDRLRCPRPGRRPISNGCRNIRPWCISRQLWWGHRIPAWFGPGGKIFVAETEAEAKAQALEHHGREEPLRQDEGRPRHLVLLRALANFSTLGWPEKTVISRGSILKATTR